MTDEKAPATGIHTAIDLVDFPIPDHKDGEPPYSQFDCQTRRGAVFAGIEAFIAGPSEILKGTPFANAKKRVSVRIVFFCDPAETLVARSFLLMPPGIGLPIHQNGAELRPIAVCFAAKHPIALYEIVHAPS